MSASKESDLIFSFLKGTLSKNELRLHLQSIYQSNSQKFPDPFRYGKQFLPEHPGILVMDAMECAHDAYVEAQKGKHAVYFSPGKECRSAIVQTIDAAVSTLDICLFTISDNEIVRPILSAHQRGIKIKILTDNDKVNDRGSDIQRLSDAGIDVKTDRTDKHMHHKFAIADNAILITGSYNWTRSAADYNEENIIVTRDSFLIKSFLKEFDSMWNEMKKFD